MFTITKTLCFQTKYRSHTNITRTMPTAKQFQSTIKKSKEVIFATPDNPKADALDNLETTKNKLKKYIGPQKAVLLSFMLLFAASGSVAAQQAPKTEVKVQTTPPKTSDCAGYRAIVTDVFHTGKDGTQFRVYVSTKGRAFIIRKTKEGKQRRDYSPKVCKTLNVADWVTK